MLRTERKTIENIILINPLIYGMQDKIDSEQDRLISDLSMPASKIVARLIELDNKRIDLCNLNVLYGFIERGLKEKFGLLRSCVYGGATAPNELYDIAVSQLALAGYTVERVNSEFEYLFKTLKKKKPLKAKSGGVRYTNSRLAIGNL